jgi:signal transduction histidine kinase/ActR/RegA family two-component response regulator
MKPLPACEPSAEATHLQHLEAENRKLRKINDVLMDRVERNLDSQAGNGFSLFQVAITLESKVSQRTADLSALTETLRQEIFERGEAEAALRVAKAEAEQANLSKTRFLVAASHDLHQPLNAARLFLGALADEVTGERPRELVERIEAALESTDDLLSALLDISRLDAGVWPIQPESFPLAPLLARLASEYRPQAQALGLELRVMPGSLVVHTDRRLLERVMRNLISNAIRYTASGRILVGCRRRGAHASLDVADTGIGIPEEKRELIFEEFRQLGNNPRRDDRGAGLGLAIVDRIVRLLGLSIAVKSRPGHGSRFTVRVPLGVAGAEGMEAPHAAPQLAGSLAGSLGGSVVVVVENDEAVQAAMAALLECWGCTLAIAASAAEAMARLDALGQVPDLIVADYHLDGESRGTAAIDMIQNNYGRDVPALVISSNHSEKLNADIRALGHSFLAKPVAPAKLRAMLSYMLSEARARSPDMRRK